MLLARKTRHIGEGRWNGYGGGIDPGENLIQGAIRECRQEAGIDIAAADLRKMAEITFHNNKSDGGQFSCLVHVFIVEHWSGEPRATEEMIDPTWFPFNQLPFSEMMPADPIWIPFVLSGKKIRGEAHYGPFQGKLLKPVVVTEVVGFD